MLKRVFSIILAISVVAPSVRAQDFLAKHKVDTEDLIRDSEDAIESECHKLLTIAKVPANESIIKDLKQKCETEISLAENEIKSLRTQISSLKTKVTGKKWLAISVATVSVLAVFSGWLGDIGNNLRQATGRITYAEAEEYGSVIIAKRYKIGLAGAGIATTSYLLMRIDRAELSLLSAKLEGKLKMLGAQKASLESIAAVTEIVTQ